MRFTGLPSEVGNVSDARTCGIVSSFVQVIVDPGWYSASNVNTKPQDLEISLP